jgi:hypothetical protein
MLTLLFAVTALVMAGFTAAAFRLRAPLAALVCAALAYDNGCIALGASLGEGTVLETLNTGRFWAHALITPLMVVVGWRQARLRATAALTALVAVLIGYGVYTEIVLLRLEPQREHGTLRYVNVAAEGPPIAAIVTILVLIVLGALIWRRRGRPWLLAGAVAMFVAAGAGAQLVWLQNLGELALLTGLLITLRAARSAAELAPTP